MNALIEKYQVDATSGLVNYSALCDNIDHVFTDAADPKAAIDNSKSSANFTDGEKDILLALLEAIRTEIVNKRILIKPQFQDYDRTNCCHITAE